MAFYDFERRKDPLTIESKNASPLRLPYYEYENAQLDIEDNDEINLRDYIRRVQRHKWTVILITIILTSAATIYLYQEPSLYEASARVQIDSDTAYDLDSLRGGISPFEDRAYFNTQMEILESPELIRRVVKRLNLEKDPTFINGLSSTSNKFVSLMAPINLKPSAVDPPQAENVQPVSTESERQAEAERLNPFVVAINDSLKVQPVLQTRQAVKDTRLISIRFKHPNPKTTASVVNALADELVKFNLNKKTQSNSNQNDYLQTNISELQAQIRRAEERLLTYGKNYQLPSQDDKQNTVVERLVGLNKQLLDAEEFRKQAEAAYKSALAPGAADALSEINAKDVTDIEAKLDDLRQRRAQLLVGVTEKYPAVVEIDKQISVMQKAAENKRSRASSLYTTNLETRYRESLARENSIRESYNKQWGKTLNQNGAAINYRIIHQELETNRKLLDEMQRRQKENEMLVAKTPNNIQVADYAITPTEILDPKRTQFVGLAFLLSFSLGVGAALIRDYFDDSVRTTHEVEKTLSLPALAAIPQVRNGFFFGRAKSTSTNLLHLTDEGANEYLPSAGGSELVINNDSHSPLAEAFRQLRAVLLFSPEIGQVKTLLITSSAQAEGKTTTAVNIAATLSQTGAKVLLIDADLRNPRLHRIFGFDNNYGLSNFLLEDSKTETELLGQITVVEDETKSILKKLVKQSDTFYVLPSGLMPFDSAQCLGSKKMKEFLTKLESEFDFIVIDSPPVSAFADSAVLASIVDGVLLVVQGNRSSSEMLRHSQRLLRMVGANIVGVVMNKVSGSTERYYRN